MFVQCACNIQKTIREVLVCVLTRADKQPFKNPAKEEISTSGVRSVFTKKDSLDLWIELIELLGIKSVEFLNSQLN